MTIWTSKKICEMSMISKLKVVWLDNPKYVKYIPITHSFYLIRLAKFSWHKLRSWKLGVSELLLLLYCHQFMFHGSRLFPNTLNPLEYSSMSHVCSNRSWDSECIRRYSWRVWASLCSSWWFGICNFIACNTNQPLGDNWFGYVRSI